MLARLLIFVSSVSLIYSAYLAWLARSVALHTVQAPTLTFGSPVPLPVIAQALGSFVLLNVGILMSAPRLKGVTWASEMSKRTIDQETIEQRQWKRVSSPRISCFPSLHSFANSRPRRTAGRLRKGLGRSSDQDSTSFTSPSAGMSVPGRTPSPLGASGSLNTATPTRLNVTSPPLSPSPSPTPVIRDLDYSFLTSPDFTNEADWLNATLTNSLPDDSSLSSIESTLSSTLYSLELSLNDTSTLVDRSISDISSSVPRLTFDLQLMRENALLLRFTLDAIRKRGTGFGSESEVGKVIERIRVLDLVKNRMEAARDVLREAESWSTLESEVTGLVSEEQFLKAAERLAEAARSMVVFQNTAEYEGRRALMVSLQNQLEASLSSRLVKAIQERDVKGCKTLWNIFGMIQREQEYRSYYFGSRRSHLVDAWSGAKLVDCADESNTTTIPLPTTQQLASSNVTSTRLSTSEPLKFSQFISHFYSELYQLVTEERTYLPAIFPNPIPTLSSFIETSLEGLQPSLPQRLNSILESYGPLFLPELIAAFKATEEFAVRVERIFQKLEPTLPDPPPPMLHHSSSSSDHHQSSPHSPSRSSSVSNSATTTTTPTPSVGTPSKRRLSTKRRSLSKRLSSRSISFAVGSSPLLGSSEQQNDAAHSGGGGGDSEDEENGLERGGGGNVRVWETSLFEPFLDFQVDYPNLERRYLEYEIQKSVLNSRGGESGGSEAGNVDWIDQSIGGGSSTSVVDTRGGDRSFRSSSSSSEAGPKLLVERVSRLFTLFEDAVGRNLALTHGYGAKGLVQVLDDEMVSFLESRKEELVSVSKRRIALKAKGKQRRQNQDSSGNGIMGDGREREEEEMVLEGLEYSSQDWETFQFGLRLLDSCRRIEEKLNAFEGRLKSRMVILGHAVKQARENPATFTIPGTTRGEILLLRQSTLNSAELNNMLEGLELGGGGGRGRSLLPRSKGASVDFTRTTQIFLHETLLAPLLSHLGEYSSLSYWTTSNERAGGKGAFDLSIPTFSLSPTETISRVGEGLFNLPRLFEVYAQDDALAYSIETLPFVDVEALRSLQHLEPPPMLRQSSSNGPSSSGGGVHRSSISSLPPPPPAQIPVIPLSAETVIATWLSSLTLSILSHITLAVLPSLNRLSKHGAAQLVSDLDYISNVARALDVESPDELESWREAVAMDDKSLREGGNVDGESRIDKGILERVAKIRD
ncbi:uncharacterized protein JCM6883_000071 [Sporobolomyces salmoneus]|uniref:uncharacterized protein n=1 Tax=Sporobolomyces salmoneus TaxID=183962 RepID=UPI00316CA179